ncbi:MAG: DivIVA domain-containing protein [Acidobacteriota bacterium]|nr:DivIVA domain-containing protein [Acidobacteriota bacterium]MDE3043724.1 DivIVA domain-containing protein [Acidobacteriota bacterium]MDE3107147.1 DivIVA domain-containing protein [Acidobacteriota bacterium]
MDSTEHASSALDAIETVAFKVGLKGYNVDEVDDFLERLAVETRQLKDLVQQQRQQLRQASERIAQLDARGSAPAAPAPAPAPAPVATTRGASGGAEQITSMIAMAQQFIESAQHEAQNKAKELTTAAQERAREIVAEARSRAEDEVNRLNGLKQRLSEDVDTLARQLEAERARLGGWLAEFTRWVESSLQVATTPKPVRESAPEPPTVAPASAPSAPVTALRQTPPPAPPPAPAPTIGQVLNFDQSSRDERS